VEGTHLLRFCFTKADRIRKRSEFLRLSKIGKKIQNRHFVANFSPDRFQRTRLGITVTRKVGRATTRNRIKRFIREYFRLNRHIITGYWDINIIAKKKAGDISSGETFLSLQNIFDNISRSIDN
jgi:ribonuclease P protein component